ncbi:MAG TPA: DUF1588 domain-containing protein, partial [Myxococcales bacterium]|nr:DUF1588 domain-containing protein [Myxococcales bacterium]
MDFATCCYCLKAEVFKRRRRNALRGDVTMLRRTQSVIISVALCGIFIWTSTLIGCSPDGRGATDSPSTDTPGSVSPGELTGNDDPESQTPESEVDSTASVDPKESTPDCQSNEQFFTEELWVPVLATNCFSCHNSLGAAKHTRFILKDGYTTGFMSYNMDVLKENADYEKNGTPLLLLKPLGEDNHGGGARLDKSSPEFSALKEMLLRFKNPVECNDSIEGNLFSGVVTLGPVDTLRKARLALTGTLPTMDEYQAVQVGGEKELAKALDAMMEDPNFLVWVKEVYNDRFLSRRFSNENDAIKLLNDKDYPNKNWFEDCDEKLHPQCLNKDFKAMAAQYTNWSVAEEPLELVSHIVRNNLPFTEVITATYTMANPFSAKVYGAEEVFFNNPLDIHEFRPVQHQVVRNDMPVNVPHAGVLTSPIWLNRFPSTDTNVNRHRSRMVHLFFLATDVLKLAERAIDQATIKAHNPTMNEAKCAICHATLDPVAGAFLNWNAAGRYMPPETGWHTDMRPPGFEEEDIPKSALNGSLNWLAERISGDQRFVTSVVHTVFVGLTGQQPLSPPTDPTVPDYKLRLGVFMQQAQYLQGIGDNFAANGYNFKTVVRNIVMSPYFRASNLASRDEPATNGQLVALEEVGMGRLLTPEQLNRRIKAVLGAHWATMSGEEYLTGEYKVQYGGTDFKGDGTRISEPNGIMANIAERMANEMACKSVALDFSIESDKRQLFPIVEMDYAPFEKHGFEVPAT